MRKLPLPEKDIFIYITPNFNLMFTSAGIYMFTMFMRRGGRGGVYVLFLYDAIHNFILKMLVNARLQF